MNLNHAELIARYDGRVPRYTSYPTAVQFSNDVGAEQYADWLGMVSAATPISLYLHVPFCERLCLYCGCNTTVVRQDSPRRTYAELLAKEITMLATHIGHRAEVASVHWGGGTPTTLPDDCLTNLMDLIREKFVLRPNAEIAIEIDPASFNENRCQTLKAMGINRASLGVQDFDPQVQAAIGRPQSFAETQACATALRRAGVSALNLDLIYGLPHQTEESVKQTAQQALALRAGRIAVFGYAHVPWMKRHQSLIPESSLPDANARFAQLNTIAHVLERAGGFMPIGLDHYAQADDALAKAAAAKLLRRSFQGYTTDAAPVLLGIGASAIGHLPAAYVQNATSVREYGAAINAGVLATARGVALTLEDRMRRTVIEKIMCDLEVDLIETAREFGCDAALLLKDSPRLATFAQDGLLKWDGRRIDISPAGRPFIRSIASTFDAYLVRNETGLRHARAM